MASPHFRATFHLSRRFLLCFLVLCLLCSLSLCSIFSSIIRNNLNRYLKNPLFTKSLVPQNPWPNQFDEHGSPGMVSPQNGQINEFIKSQNKFTSDHLMDSSFGGHNYNLELLTLQNEFPGIVPVPSQKQMPTSAMQSQRTTHHMPPPTTMMPNINAAPGPLNRASPNGTALPFEDRSNRLNSKSLIVSESKINAYSDSNKLKQINKSSSLYGHKVTNNTNRYIDNLKSAVDTARLNINVESNRNLENHLSNGNKYNQEKALNLKMEYGFRPLPGSGNKPSEESFRKDFTVTNSIQLTDPFEKYLKTNDLAAEQEKDANKEGADANESGNNIYSSVTDDSNTRSMKSLQLDSNNHLDDFTSADYKKYISYPMETESSDIHKLAFTGMESFKPEHSYSDSSLSFDNRFVDTLTDYPNIKQFKSQGIDCARNSGYCEYDSSYPKDYVNSIVANCSDRIDDMYIEMPEDLADFSGYKSFIQVGRSSNSHQANSSLCDSERKYIRPSVIQDVNGHFYLILQSSFYFQQVPVEICTKPGMACNVVGRCSSQVKCTQKYRTHTLISIDDHSAGAPPLDRHCPRIRMYRLPSSCVCELSRV